jgi:hypothetical protein
MRSSSLIDNARQLEHPTEPSKIVLLDWTGGRSENLKDAVAPLKQARDDLSKVKAVIVVEDPVVALTRQLEKLPIADAINAWRDAIAELLETRRKMRNQIILANVACLSEPNEQEKETLEDFSRGTKLDRAYAAHAAAPSNLCLVYATAIVDEDLALKALAAKLRACTIGGLRTPRLSDVSRAAWQDQKTQNQAQSELQRQLTENQTRTAAFKQALDTVNTSSAKIQKDNSQLEEKIRDLSTERDLLRETLTLQSEALISAASAETQLGQQSAELSANKHEIRALRASLREESDQKLSLESQLQSAREYARRISYFASFEPIASGRQAPQACPRDEPTDRVAAFICDRTNRNTPQAFSPLDDWTDKLKPGQAGAREDHVIRSRRQRGHVFYGPYLTLESGELAADLRLRLETGLRSDGYAVEIVSSGTVLASTTFRLRRGSNRVLIPFYIPSSLPHHECEVRLYSPGTSVLALEQLQILKPTYVTQP